MTAGAVRTDPKARRIGCKDRSATRANEPSGQPTSSYASRLPDEAWRWTVGAGYRNQSIQFKSCSETNYPQPSRALHKNSGTASAKDSSTEWAKFRSGSRPSGSYPARHTRRGTRRRRDRLSRNAASDAARSPIRRAGQGKAMGRDGTRRAGYDRPDRKAAGNFLHWKHRADARRILADRQGELSMKAEFDARLYFPNEPDDKP